jgi:hypothetical protein
MVGPSRKRANDKRLSQCGGAMSSPLLAIKLRIWSRKLAGANRRGTLTGGIECRFENPMTAKDILEEIKPLGSDSYKKILFNHGVKEPCFGVKIGDLKKIQKRIKRTIASHSIFTTPAFMTRCIWLD